MIIFLDESGDLGFDWLKNKTSSYFVISLLVCNNGQTAEAIKYAVRRTLRNKLNHSKCTRVVGELKGATTSLAIKEYFLAQMPAEGWHIYSVTLNKRKVSTHLTTNSGKVRLYNFLARFLIEKIKFPKILPSVNLVVDRCKSPDEIMDFNFYIQNQLQAFLALDTRFYISHETSHESYGLQAVDLFCWGIARKNLGEFLWYEKFKDKISYETVYLE